jgi:O-antigen/teichoic acid export membrane protein
LTGLRRNTIANVVGRVATALLWVAVTPYVLVRLGAERFGIWALFFAFNGYLLALDLGVGSAMIRFVAAERGSGDRRGLTRTLWRGLRLAITLGLFWALFVALARGWIASAFHVPEAMVPETLDALLIFGIGILLMFPAQVLMGSLQGFERLDLSNVCTGLSVAAQVLALYLGLAAGGGLKAAAAAGVIGQAVAGLVAAVLVRQQLREVRSAEVSSGPSWRDLLHFGAALQLTGFLLVFQIQWGKIFLGLLGNLALVADYEIALRVASGVAGMPIMILGAVVPAVSRAWESEGAAAVTSIYTSTLRWLYTTSVVVLGLLWLVAPDITRVWLGPGNDRIADLIRLWAVACAVAFAWSPGGAVARGVGKPWIEVWSLVVTVLVNVGLGVWCIPRYGTAGAVAAIGASYGAGFVAFVVYSRRSGIPFGPWITRELVPRALAAWAAVAACAWLFAARPVASRLPPPGWIHGTVVTIVFLALFAILFAPTGDTQRLSRTVRQMTAGVLAGRRGSPAAS